MASGRFGPASEQIDRLFGPSGTATALAGRSLLERFARDRDDAAFEALVARHGPMVLGVCRRALDRPDDVEDAFQATFVVLARRAASIRDGDRLGPWLHGVARRVSARARARAFARRSREGSPLPETYATADAGSDLEAVELRSTLDDELARLPEKYRAPLVLCYLEGLTHDEAAAHLGWPVGTVRSRLSGGRDLLRARLSRRGLAPSAGLSGVLPAVPLSESLISATARLATATGAAVPAHVAVLAKGALVIMKWGSLKSASPLLALLAGLVAGGAGVVAWRSESAASDARTATETLQRTLVATQARVQSLEQELANRRVADGEAPPNPGMSAEMVGMTPGPGAAMGMMGGPGAGPPIMRDAGVDPGVSLKGSLIGVSSETAMPPEVHPIHRDNGPPLLITISDSRDRVTVIDTVAQKAATFRLPENSATEIEAVDHQEVVVLKMKGPAITRTAVFDPKGFRWSEHDLKEPVTELDPSFTPNFIAFSPKAAKLTRIPFYDIRNQSWSDFELAEPAEGSVALLTGGGMATCTVGRFFYAFSEQSEKWSVLERGKDAVVVTLGKPADRMGSSQAGEITILDEDVIHIYDPKTGDWTHISTKDDK